MLLQILHAEIPNYMKIYYQFYDIGLENINEVETLCKVTTSKN